MKSTKVKNFTYNGFFVKDKPGYANYRATFKEWTSDPGIACFKCSDGKERLIPTCMIDKSFKLPEQKKTGVLFGHSFTS